MVARAREMEELKLDERCTTLVRAAMEAMTKKGVWFRTANTDHLLELNEFEYNVILIDVACLRIIVIMFDHCTDGVWCYACSPCTA